MNIGFDIDGVLADFNSAYINVMHAFGYEIPSLTDDFPTDWFYMTKTCGVPQDVDDAVWAVFKKCPQFWASFKPTPECASTVKHLQGKKVSFITSRPGENAWVVALEWLQKQGFNPTGIYVANTPGAKRYCAETLGLDFFIDDKPENCIAIRDVVKSVFILDKPWNRSWVEPSNIIRAYTIQQALEMGGVIDSNYN